MILLDHFVDVLLVAPAPTRRRMLRAYGEALRASTRPPAATRSPAPLAGDITRPDARFWARVRAALAGRR